MSEFRVQRSTHFRTAKLQLHCVLQILACSPLSFGLTKASYGRIHQLLNYEVQSVDSSILFYNYVDIIIYVLLY